MSYATKEGKRDWARRYRAQKHARGECFLCTRPCVTATLCAYHATTQRTRSRRWMQARHGYVPREPFAFSGEWLPTYWERIGGWWQRVSADFRDPLTILLEKEAQGTWSWRAG